MSSSKILRVGGGLVAVVAAIFVARSVYGYADQLSEVIYRPQFIAVVVAGTIVYALSLQLVGLAWFSLLASVGENAIAPVLALRIFARTQVYKYLPTNVIHLVGRFVVASRYDASKDALSYAQMMEIVLMIFAAGSVAMIFSYSFVRRVGEEYGFNPDVASSVYIIAGAAVFLLAFVAAARYFRSRQRRLTISMVALSLAYYILFFLANGLIFSALVQSLYGQTTEWKMTIGISAAGWLLGFVVPGAPGGLGVREAVFIAGLSTAGIPTAASTTVAITHRVVTLLGDVLLAVLEFGYQRWIAKSV
ncbi:lysylphosphatidylglycerol synthase transmembrane domain-containing protein [Mesorhizobium sp. J8]|uniref:lysylphosphatidylglycerol synthase transmembrane domain-containing protein n=1 Tax=Mesorhizobium sp. J8 TaxID=2777475 RepID=UPI0019156FC9|nr:YbhN family protein [Mesorhizobium sp. J8]BCM18242.1 hypothetical protein MJ8_20100 [Mesorhizobium sp. J8]